MPLIASLRADATTDVVSHRARQLAAIAVGTLVLATSSYISVPMIPVPITLQTLAVVLVGAFYGWRLGGVTIGAWLMEGALGLPVFSGGGAGPLAFMGPTAGYIWSFPLVGMLAGWLVARGWDGTRPVFAFAAAMIAQTLCLIIGAMWLAVLIGPQNAVTAGVLPFIPGAFAKAALAAATLASWHAARRQFGQK